MALGNLFFGSQIAKAQTRREALAIVARDSDRELTRKPRDWVASSGMAWSRRRRLLTVIFALAASAGVAWWVIMRMPGKSYRAALKPLSAVEAALRDELRRDVEHIAGSIGERNWEQYSALVAAADFINESLGAAGYSVLRQGYQLHGRNFDNLIVERLGGSKAGEVVVIGAHYDTVPGCPGANDNGTGVAALLALARRFAGFQPARTVRFVAFVNEEPFHFHSPDMGSHVYAKSCHERGENIVAMLSLETIGCFSDEPRSQHFPLPGLGTIYPTTGNFIAFVGNLSSGSLVRKAVGAFRKHAEFPSEGAVLPAAVPGVGWSDHWSFWQFDYPALMVTDTAPFRYAHYHQPTDTPDKIDYDRLARVVAGLEKVIGDLSRGSEK